MKKLQPTGRCSLAAALDLYATLAACAEMLQELVASGSATEKTKRLTKKVLAALAKVQG